MINYLMQWEDLRVLQQTEAELDSSVLLCQGREIFVGRNYSFWALLPKSTTNLPSSTRTVYTLVEVEAFAMRAEDLKWHINLDASIAKSCNILSYYIPTTGGRGLPVLYRKRYKRNKLSKCLTAIESFAESET
ncbi:hypothetical protein Vadar_020127 [Vaccinium darrowii]|uniref:Uncharacterized protein n=1 Tax=Vaccinium darrowii TaxID=229202 RepID=A0ACB7Z5H8_9ERIC|nr:hypothetical protein Vadar_020127 [Vaccinium darrowii]